MNNLHRELAPISSGAWAQIEEEASRTLKRYLAARRVVDVQGPKGFEFSAVGTGHLQQIATPGDGIQSAQREAKALVELRIPFVLTRQAIDDVERGALDSDWSPLKDAARKIAFAEDRAVFEGYASAGIQGRSRPFAASSSRARTSLSESTPLTTSLRTNVLGMSASISPCPRGNAVLVIMISRGTGRGLASYHTARQNMNSSPITGPIDSHWDRRPSRRVE